MTRVAEKLEELEGRIESVEQECHTISGSLRKIEGTQSQVVEMLQAQDKAHAVDQGEAKRENRDTRDRLSAVERTTRDADAVLIDLDNHLKQHDWRMAEWRGHVTKIMLAAGGVVVTMAAVVVVIGVIVLLRQG